MPLQAAWPRTTQLATAFLLGAAATLLGLQAWQTFGPTGRPSELHASRFQQPIDLNRATRAELLQLPGIGPALAERIENYRQRHGPFRRFEDLLDVTGIGPRLLEQLRPCLVVRVPANEDQLVPVTGKAEPAEAPPLIDLNQATSEQLQRLPGIGPVLSQRIVEERGKAPFRSVEDLLRVRGIGPKTLQRIRPLICVRAEA